MMMTIALVLVFLVAFNFLLLFVSCTKTTKENVIEKPLVLEKKMKMTVVKSPLASAHLAPTGS